MTSSLWELIFLRAITAGCRQMFGELNCGLPRNIRRQIYEASVVAIVASVSSRGDTGGYYCRRLHYLFMAGKVFYWSRHSHLLK